MSAYSQSSEELIGSGLSPNLIKSTTIFDLADPQAVNIKISVWGGVRSPGYYIVPNYTDMKTLISFAGGLTENSKADDLRIFRTQKDSTQELIKFNFEDLFQGENLQNFKAAPKLMAGDVVVIPLQQKFYLKDYLSLGLSSLAVILNIVYIVESRK
jgi:protein involved in polysaccharide export with SLBB domain